MVQRSTAHQNIEEVKEKEADMNVDTRYTNSNVCI